MPPCGGGGSSGRAGSTDLSLGGGKVTTVPPAIGRSGLIQPDIAYAQHLHVSCRGQSVLVSKSHTLTGRPSGGWMIYEVLPSATVTGEAKVWTSVYGRCDDNS
jgi:hypothetical protein